MKTQELQTPENTKRKVTFINLHNTRRIQWNTYRRYALSF